MDIIEPIIIALAAGFLPAGIWIWFWLNEDKAKPEPKSIIARTFLAGMIAVIVVLPFQKLINDAVGNSITASFFLWATAEEIVKYLACYIAAFRSKFFDEPVDAVLYLIITALGFAALENTLFLIDPIIQGNILETIITGNMRFIGASLLHILSSATIGAFMAFSFYRTQTVKKKYLIIGIISAVLLHSLFNLLIIMNKMGVLITFSAVWFGIIVILLLFEKIKQFPIRNKILFYEKKK